MHKLTYLRAVAAGIALCAATSVAAESTDARPWLVVPAVSDTAPAQLEAATDAARALEDALTNAGETVLTNVAAAERFETRNPAAGSIDAERQKLLFDALATARRELAFGHLAEAEAALEPIARLESAELDFLRRSHASMLYETCVARAHILLRDGQVGAARKAMGQCIATYPALPTPSPPEIRQLYEDAKKSLTFGNLAVKGPSGCTVRVFGVAVGRAPVTAHIAAGPTAVQLECAGNMPGRRHLADVGPATNSIEIDPRFDQVVMSTGALQLVYDQQTALRSHVEHDADLLGRVLGARVILLESAGKRTAYKVSTRTKSAGELGELHYDEREGAARADVRRVVQALRRDTRELAPSITRGSASDVTAIAAATGTQSPTVPTSVDEHDWVRPSAVAALGVLGTAGLVASWAVYAARQDFRLETRPLITYDVLAAFHRRGAWMLGLGGVGSAALISAEYLLLPSSDEGVPIAGWLVGAAGVVVAGAGVAYAVGGDRCEPMATRVPRACYARTADALFGPMLILSSLSLLNVPLVYWLRGWLGNRESAVAVTLTGVQFSRRF